MPVPWIVKYAKERNVTVRLLERYWADCMQGIEPGRKRGYGLVVNCVKAKLRAHKRKGRKSNGK